MSKWEVAVTRLLPEAGMDMLHGSCNVRLWEEDRPIPHDKLCALAQGAHGIVCVLTDQVDKAVMEAAGPNLKAISTMAVGHDNIDVAEATRRGIVVGNTPGVLTEATADLTWALILALSRRILAGDRMVREGRFNGWGPTLLVGADFKDRTLGIVGMGRIGTAVSRRAVGFGMKILYHARHRLAPELEAAVPAHFEKLGDLLKKSDFVSLHCPLNQESFHLIGAAELAEMKPTAYLINVARGPVVDEAALVAALRDRRLAGAALDVYENEPRLAPGLIELDNVVLTPHLGSASLETRNKMAVMAAQNLITGLRGDVPPWCLNPEARPVTES